MNESASNRNSGYIRPRKKPKGYIETSKLVLLAFVPAFFSRALVLVGVPSMINFLHFATIPLALGVALAKTRMKNQQQISIVWAIFSGLLVLLGVILTSALWNNAGLANAIVDFLLLGEPFILLLALISLSTSPESTKKLRTWLISFGFINLFLAFTNYILFVYLGIQHPRGFSAGNPDNVQGIFFPSGAGHVVSASVSMTFGLYYLVSAKNAPTWFRISVALVTFLQMILADAKQVLLVFLIAWLLLLVIKLKNPIRALQYLIVAILFISLFIWCIQNVPYFEGFNIWANLELYGPNGDATKLKLASIRIILSYYNSPLNWLLGLGPGHTVGRLGGWMLREYGDLLAPFYPTRHPATKDVWQAVGSNWLGDQSSIFSPLYGWAGIWGDLGFLGLGAYLYLAWLVWRYICLDDLSRFLLLSVFGFGLIFSQMEEPGYMLFVAMIVGLRWQEHRVWFESG